MYRLNAKGEEPAKLKQSVEEILAQTKLLSMATASKHAEPWINTAYFGYDDSLTLYIITYPDSKHIKNLDENNQIALNIFDSRQDGAKKQGLQLAGMYSAVSTAEQDHALRVWGARVMGEDKVEQFIKDFEAWTTRPYKITVDYVKIFDEVRFGEESWVTCLVER